MNNWTVQFKFFYQIIFMSISCSGGHKLETSRFLKKELKEKWSLEYQINFRDVVVLKPKRTSLLLNVQILFSLSRGSLHHAKKL